MARIPLSEENVRQAMTVVPEWSRDGIASIERKFEFKDHIAALGFVVQVATVAETLDHHPEVNWVYNKVRLTLSTHDAGGITQRDFDLAARIDKIR